MIQNEITLTLRYPHESPTIHCVSECKGNLPPQGLQMYPRIVDFS